MTAVPGQNLSRPDGRPNGLHRQRTHDSRSNGCYQTGGKVGGGSASRRFSLQLWYVSCRVTGLMVFVLLTYFALTAAELFAFTFLLRDEAAIR
jgi:hypothetical protein